MTGATGGGVICPVEGASVAGEGVEVVAVVEAVVGGAVVVDAAAIRSASTMSSGTSLPTARLSAAVNSRAVPPEQPASTTIDAANNEATRCLIMTDLRT